MEKGSENKKPQYNKKYYDNHKHKYQERMTCEYCGKNIRRYGANKHYYTKKCKKFWQENFTIE